MCVCVCVCVCVRCVSVVLCLWSRSARGTLVDLWGATRKRVSVWSFLCRRLSVAVLVRLCARARVCVCVCVCSCMVLPTIVCCFL